MTDFSKEFELAISLAKEAGSHIKQVFYKREFSLSSCARQNQSDYNQTLDNPSITHKDKLGLDLVTVTDKYVENLVCEKIKQSFPDDLFIGEETSHELHEKFIQEQQGTSHNIHASIEEKAMKYIRTKFYTSRSWVLDPIDGTTNFVHGFPFVCISIAFCFKGEPVVAVVYNPIMDELYHAIKGKGAWMNDQKLPLFKNQMIQGNGEHNSLFLGLVATEVGSERTPDVFTKRVNSMSNIALSPCRDIRALGSAALSCCYVARGSLELYWQAGIHVWDVAAGALILSESGNAFITNFDYDLSQNENVMRNKDLPNIKCDLLCRKFIAMQKFGDESQTLVMLSKVQKYLNPADLKPDFTC